MILYILNSLVVPFKDEKAYFMIKRIDPNEAKKIVKAHGFQFTSAIGHPTTAYLLSLLLGVTVPVDRKEVYFDIGDEAITLVLKKRLAEGQTLKSIQELEAVGYKLFHIKRVA